MLKSATYLLVAALLAGVVTGPKLVKMAMIKGWLPGGTPIVSEVVDLWHETERNGEPRDTYWVATSGDIREVGPHRLNVPEPVWSSLDIGSSIETVRVGRDPTPYIRNGIFVSAGNFVFDAVLLLIELGVIATMGHRLLRAGRGAGVEGEPA